MKRLTKICMPVLILGAAVVAVPATAQIETNASASNNAAAAAPAQPAQDANSAAVPAGSANANAAGQTALNSQPSANASASSSTSANSQMAMNTTGNAGDLSSIPDTQKKYNRAKRNADDRSEDATTRQLNQKESSLNGASSGNAQ